MEHLFPFTSLQAATSRIAALRKKYPKLAEYDFKQHDTRRMVAQKAFEAGGIKQVKEELGHGSTKVSKLYVQ